MYDSIKMQITSANILLENGNDNKELINKLVLSNITLLRYLGAVTGNEDYTDLAHILTEIALNSSLLDESTKQDIQSIINNEEETRE